jgi:hypothetical protein
MASPTRRATPALIAAFLAAASSPLAAAPARVPNKQPYKVTATATATGRTGSGTMSARALIDRNHHALLEIAAGDLETPPAGTVSKLQLKAFDGNGDLLYANNYGGLNTGDRRRPD